MPAGVEFEIFSSLDSTNAEVVRRAHAGASGPLWIMAHEQTQSRGRRGRVWHSGRGNFAGSLLLRVSGEPARVALRSFIAALAVRGALVELGCNADTLSLKWPNDVLLNGAKLAGILLESGTDPAGAYLCIGIGVNLASVPDASDLETGAAPPAHLGPLGMSISPEDFLATLAQEFDRRERGFQQYGFAPVRAEWLKYAARLGETVNARMMNRTMSGRFETIDETGAIVLQTQAGRITLPAAEIFFEE